MMCSVKFVEKFTLKQSIDYGSEQWLRFANKFYCGQVST
jgi:hypothetical protein